MADEIKEVERGDTVTIRLSEIPIDDPQVVRLIISAEDLYKEVGKNG